MNEEAEKRARELIAQGYSSTSNKYRLLAKLPDGGKTAMELLAEKEPQWLQRWEEMAKSQYLRVHAPHIEVDEETYRAFRLLGGRSA